MNISQKRAWAELIIFLAMTAAAAGVVISMGVPVVECCTDDSTRITITFILLAGGLLIGVVHFITRPKEKHLARDERDIDIQRGAMTTQMVVTMLSIMVWVVALSEVFHDHGAVPIGYLYLILITTILFNLLSRHISIIIGYWRGSK